MKYLIAILCPPLALLLCGKIFQALFNLILWIMSWVLAFFFGAGLLLWAVCSAHACLVVSQTAAERRHKQTLKEMRKAGLEAP